MLEPTFDNRPVAIDRRDTRRPDADRRSSVRTAGGTSVRILRAGGGQIVDANVLDVSAVGIRIATQQHVALGDALFIEVQTPERTDSVLARAVRQDHNVFGCEFDVELGPTRCADIRKAIGAAV